MHQVIRSFITSIRTRKLLATVSLICLLGLGCNAVTNENSGGETGGPNSESAESNEGYLAQATNLFQKAKEAGETTASNASEWLGSTVNGAMSATGNAAQDTGDWVNETFQSLKAQGMTSASDATQWVQEDIRNMSSFEYLVLPKDLTTASEQLNELGKERWDCFAVDDNAFYLKRQKKSYLKNVPVKDLLKFLPIGSGE